MRTANCVLKELVILQGSWDFTERARQSIQEEDGLLAAKAAKSNFTQRGKAQSSLERPAPGASGEVTLLLPCCHRCLVVWQKRLMCFDNWSSKG